MSDCTACIRAEIKERADALDTLAVEHDIDGKKVALLLGLRRLSEGENGAGLSKETLCFYAKEAELTPRPRVNAPLRFDGLHYVVANCTESDGVLKVVLARQNAGV